MTTAPSSESSLDHRSTALEAYQDCWDFNSEDRELVEKSKRIDKLQSDEAPANAGTLYVCIQIQNLDAVERLLSAGVNANARLHPEDDWILMIVRFWHCYAVAPHNGFYEDHREWFPLYQAAFSKTGGKEERRDRKAGVMAALLRHNADPYAIFQQPLKNFKSSKVALFPPDVATRVWAPLDEDTDYTTETELEHPPKVRRENAPRSVIHAILQDGGFVKPILNFPGFTLDLEHRDPEGRTLVLSACRSAVGADAPDNASLSDVSSGFSQAPNTLLDAFINRGANLLAVDNEGKNAIHQLLDAYDTCIRPPIIRQSLRTILAKHPTLVNQPDYRGTYPLHAALRRLWRYDPDRCGHQHDHDHIQAEHVIEDLLAGGADPHVRDRRGNTALHYLASNTLADRRFKEDARRLFHLIIERGVDVNGRNKAGRSALEMLLDSSGWGLTGTVINDERDRTFFEEEKAIDTEIFNLLDRAGVHWTDRDPAGNTALHLVARHWISRNAPRAEFLISKGVDPMLKDREGRTARNIANVTENDVMLKFFQDKGILESNEVEAGALI